ncbi:MAG: energy transducer TonB [Rhodoferax ferrireducens]|uniref:Energy transducer TonB n=2 Tax=Pseudomonadota TaxID=1224 RepID=A0A1Y1QZN9_9GAMM|nr:MAG: energy transducer TonB [Rhodoferax ferrireducens]OQX16973.1 MAG: energy transducer TonB [Thiothrix lacustris]
MRSFSTLQIALGVSLAVHAALLTVRFVDPEAFNRVFEDTPLEVILVNAKTDEKPTKARAMAQANMAGGGNLDKGRATSPLPNAVVSMQGEVSEQDRERQVREMQEQQKVLLSKVKSALAAMPPTEPVQKKLSPEEVQREEKRRQLIELLAEIERRIQMENERPKKRYISPATREAVYAIYYDRLRRAIEDKGTENFPEASGQKLYGELTMIVTVNHDGRVIATEVVQSSGNALLDRRALAIAKGAGPFGAFNREMRRQADQIAVVSRFKFTRDDTLQTRLNAP